MSTFFDFGLHPNTETSIRKMGFEQATPIQKQAIPIALSGKDMIGQAQTGTGKTTAFGIPLVELVNSNPEPAQAIVLAPTRELAVQVAEELNKIGQDHGIKTLPIYGGQPIGRQIKDLKQRPQIIAATPGRLMDHMRRRTIRTDNIRAVVLDEADEMLNMGFIEDIETILGQIKTDYQTMLFSATMPKPIQKLAERFMTDPEIVRVKATEMTVKKIDQYYLEMREKQKFDTLCRLLDIQQPELAIIFGRTKKRVDELTHALKKRGFSAGGTHGDLTQAKRDQVLRLFKEQTVNILVATDVAARGLDISGVSHVYNFDLPQDPESYVHRIGRTGRAGKEGMAITFVTPSEKEHIQRIEKVTKKTMEKMPTPSHREVIEANRKEAIGRLASIINQGNIREETKELADTLLKQYDERDLVAAALTIATKHPNMAPVTITPVSPLRAKKPKNNNNRNRRPNNRYDRNDRNDRNRRRSNDRNRGRNTKRR